MKSLEINTPIKTFQGKEVQDGMKEGEDKIIRIKDLLIQYVGQLFEGENKARVLLAYKIAQKIYNHEGDDKLELEDAEFKLVVDATNKPKMGHGPMILGPVLEALEQAEKDADKTTEA
jgi:hypothetical protein